MKTASILLPINGFSPDATPDAPGLRECDGFLPTVRGMVTAPVPVNVATTGLPVNVIGMDTIANNFNNPELYAGTASDLYYLDSANIWQLVSRSGGYSPSIGGITRWHFSTFGSARLAFNIDVQIQTKGGSWQGASTFENLATAPNAAIVERVGLFVIAFAIYEAGWGSYGDGWWCCGIGNVQQWTPSVANQTNRGRLYATPGNIVAAKALGDRIVAYKETGTYVGTYSGPPQVFRWDLAAGDEGALGADAVAVIYPNGRPVHFVVGPQRMFLFDGYRAQLIGTGEVSEYFYQRLSPSFRYRTKCVVEPAKNLVHIYFPDQLSSYPNASLVYNYITNKWGVGRAFTASEVFPLVKVLFDRKDKIVGYLNTASNTIQSVDGVADQSVSSSFRSATYGQDESKTLVTRVRPRAVGVDSSYTADLVHSASNRFNGTTTIGSQSAPMVDGKIDFLSEARWHSEFISVRGHTELSALSVSAKYVSDE